MKTGFITPLRVENLDACNWVILEDFIWVGSKGDVFTVSRGETTDFATVPWWSQAITPRTGTWTKAAVLHDKMCNLLNEFHALVKKREQLIADGAHPDHLEPLFPPPFSSIDTDAVFRKNARDGGTDVFRSELLWLGVRYGALANAARRDSWLRTAPRVFLGTVVIFALLVALVAFISWAWPW
jgi:hypothetical protein